MTPDWKNIHHVLLDMDGTLLDLDYDYFFWSELVPKHFADKENLSFEQAIAKLTPIFEHHAGTLDWYCLDFWSNRLDLDIREIKKGHRDRIAIRPGTISFLENLRAAGKQVIMATNAHPDTLALKLEQTGIDTHFDALVSSHEIGHAKEEQDFWRKLCDQYALRRQHCLFVDDSFAVLKSAQTFGIGHLLCITQPSSSHEEREVTQWPAVNYLDEVKF